MKKNKNKFIIVLLVMISIIIIGGIIIYKNNKKTEQNQTKKQEQVNVEIIDMNNTENAKIEDGVKQNTSENILKDRNLNGILITKIQLNAQEGLSHFTAKVQNNTSQDFAGGVAKIIFTNQDGSLYAELEVYIPGMKV